MVRKRGRKPDWAPNPKTGEQVDGLYVTYYPDGRIKCYYYKNKDGKQVTCGSDFFKADQKYSTYLNENNIVIAAPVIRDLEITVTEEDAADPHKLAEDITTALDAIADNKIQIDTLDISEEFWGLAEKVIKSNMQYAARRLNIPELAYITDIKPPGRSATLEELWEIFETNYDGRSRKHLHNNLKPFFKEFRRIIGKSKVRDITFQDITEYNNKIHQDKNKPTINNQYRYVNPRFTAVKSVINKAMKHIEHREDCEKLLVKLKQLNYIKKEKEDILLLQRDDHILTKKELAVLLAASSDDLLVRCGILMGLNCCIRWQDFSDTTKRMIDFEKGEYRSYRGKNMQSQASKLWTETLDALKQYTDEHPTDSDYIFLTTYKNKWTHQYLQKRFNKIRKTAGMEWLTQEQLRKMTATKSSEFGFGSDTDAYKTLMGRTIKGADRFYIHKMPSLTVDVVRELHDYYFGGKKVKKR